MLGAALLLLPTGLAAAITLRVDPSPQDVVVGSTLSVELVISELGSGAAPSLSTFDLGIAFDDSILSFLGFTFGDPIVGDQLDLSGLGSVTDVGPSAGIVNLFELSLDSPADLNALQTGSKALQNGYRALFINAQDLVDGSGFTLSQLFVPWSTPPERRRSTSRERRRRGGHRPGDGVYAVVHEGRTQAASAAWLPPADVHALGLERVCLVLAGGPSERPAAPGNLDIHETRLPDHLHVLSLQESAPDSGRPESAVGSRTGAVPRRLPLAVSAVSSCVPV
jgi:hypothetical protein